MREMDCYSHIDMQSFGQIDGHENRKIMIREVVDQSGRRGTFVTLIS